MGSADFSDPNGSQVSGVGKESRVQEFQVQGFRLQGLNQRRGLSMPLKSSDHDCKKLRQEGMVRQQVRLACGIHSEKLAPFLGSRTAKSLIQSCKCGGEGVGGAENPFRYAATL